jgi:hypothetical protein
MGLGILQDGVDHLFEGDVGGEADGKFLLRHVLLAVDDSGDVGETKLGVLRLALNEANFFTGGDECGGFWSHIVETSEGRESEKKKHWKTS